jgi:hypothetical protein
VTNDSINADKQETINATITDDFSKLTSAQMENAPRIAFTSQTIDFGTVKEGEIVKKTFDFINNGKDTLLIRKATPFFKDDCKVNILGMTALATNQSGSIEIEFDTKGRIGNDVKRTILVTTNDPAKSFVILVIKGIVVPK